jgi:hypothetical protein
MPAPANNGKLWTQEEIALLGTMPDKKLARRLKRSYESVVRRRITLGIDYANPKFKPWSKEDDLVLGTRPDEQVTLLLKRTVEYARRTDQMDRMPRWHVIFSRRPSMPCRRLVFTESSSQSHSQCQVCC